ncbi:MAG: exodeoxyribonuclease V alpha subunit [Planctomycetota bacterium]|jgi:exodeoxyribonuclease V alpha subunit
MNGLLLQLARSGDITWLSFYFAEFIAQQSDSNIDDWPALTAAMLSQESQSGSACIDLKTYCGEPIFSSRLVSMNDIPKGPDFDRWGKLLHASRCVDSPAGTTPIILDGHRLYLSRLWKYEDLIAEKIKLRLNRDATLVNSDNVGLQSELFPEGSDDQDQQLAIELATSHYFNVISGGPGSGKTTTVIKILCRLLGAEPSIRIAMAAPTGKAATRMMESIASGLARIDNSDAVRQAIPTTASTIHRLLDYRHHRYHYNRGNLLPVDCVVIDEASMIDLSLMYQLLDAIADDTRLILLGDRDQLSSVSAGNVLGDITGHGYAQTDSGTSIAKSIALLRHSYRFSDSSAIAALAKSVNRGQSSDSLELLRNADNELVWYEHDGEQLSPKLVDTILENFQPVFDSRSAAEAIIAFEKCRVLCATNIGPLGVVQINELISRRMLLRNQLAEREIFRGMPIMITRNQHQMGLYNGDTGIIWEQDDHQLQACFYNYQNGEIRHFPLNRLPGYKLAWATTVHKSQGSEFETVYLVLPSDQNSSVLSRELIYTAITRSKNHFFLQASEGVLTSAIENLTRRHSGLAAKLGWTR